MTYFSKRPPRIKQADALDQIDDHIAFALLMEMRTGKTKVIADDFGRLEAGGEANDLLIIAPAGVYKTWWKVGEEASGLPLDWPDDLVNRVNVHIWESGSYGSAKRKRELTAFLDDEGPRVLIMNVEALSTVQMARDLVINFCSAKGRRVYCAVDESTCIKSRKSERAKFCVKKVAPLCHFRRIMSGLVTPRSPLDLYCQFAFLDKRILGHDTYKSFERRYAITELMDFGGRRVPIVVGHQHTDELHGKIAPHSFRVRLIDCYDMPATDYSFRDVTLTEKQAKAYRELKEYATTMLAEEAHVTATTVITQILRLHQVLCGFTTDENGVLHEIPENRTDAVLDILEEVEGKAIIWCSYDYNIRKVSDAIIKRFGQGAVARFWGGNKSTREVEESWFKNQAGCRFMVATAAAGGRGRTWDVADFNIYHSSLNDLEQRAQSEERAKAVGKIKPLINIDMRAPGTVEEKFIKALRGKIDMAGVINGDNWREWLI